MADLFQSSGLQQDTGRISERWGQEGSEVFNKTGSYSANTTIRTVTAGKKYYVTDLIIDDRSGAAGGQFGLLDGTVGAGKLLFNANGLDGNYTYIFNTPLVFEDSVYFSKISGTITCNITMSGWEE